MGISAVVCGHPLFFSEESPLKKALLAFGRVCTGTQWGLLPLFRGWPLKFPSFCAPRVSGMDKDWTKGVLTRPKILGLVPGGTVHHRSWLFPFRAGDTEDTIQPLVADSQVNFSVHRSS